MGLDMYLTKRTWVGLNYEHNREKGQNRLIINGKELPINTLKSLNFKAGYWRKANHIHQWFVENIQDGNDDCCEYYVPRERLKELLADLS